MRLDDHRYLHELRMREPLSEDAADALPAEEGNADAGEDAFAMDDVDFDDCLSAGIPKNCVTRLMSDQDGELYYINLSMLVIRIRELLTGTAAMYAFDDSPQQGQREEEICNAVLRVLPKTVPPAFRRSAEAFASRYSSNDGDIFSAREVPLRTAIALTNGRQSILLSQSNGTLSEWVTFVDAGGDVMEGMADKSTVAAYLISMLPHRCQLRSTAAFHLNVSDRFVRGCCMVEETMRTGTLLVQNANGLAGGVWMVEGVNDARSSLGLEPIYLPGSLGVGFCPGLCRVGSITNVHELQKRVHSIEFPDSVRELGDDVFRGLRLRKVFIPRTVDCGAGFLRHIADWECPQPIIVAFECDERCTMAKRVREALARLDESALDIRFGVTREQFRAIGMNESLADGDADAGAEFELDVGEPAKPYNPYLHDENSPDDPRNLATTAEDAEELINAHRGERAWVLTYSDGGYESGEPYIGHGHRDRRRVMTYDEALAAWEAFPLDDELASALDAIKYTDERYELHILLNYAFGLDRCDSEDDGDWEWGSLIPVADRYVLYDPAEGAEDY